MYDDKSIPEGSEDNEYMWSGHKSFPFLKNDNRSFNDCVNSARNIIFIRATLWCLKMDLLYVCGLGLRERKTVETFSMNYVIEVV